MFVYLFIFIISIISLGSNDYFELSYTDPATNQLVTCTETCYLSNDSNISYQDFTVNNALSTLGIRIYINTWFGNGGGLGGVEIFHSGKYLSYYILIIY
jgi:hypothetical protein